MFGELIKLRELGRLLKQKRYLEVLQLARDDAIKDHRKALEAAEVARRMLKRQASNRRDQGEITEALRDVKVVLRDGEDSEVIELERSVREAMVDRERGARSVADEVERARGLVARGQVAEALARLQQHAEDPGAASFIDSLKAHQADAAAAVEHARRALATGELVEARQALADVRSLAVDDVEEVHAQLIGAVVKHGDGALVAGVLGDTAVLDTEPGALRDARRHAGDRLLTLVERGIADGRDVEVRPWLAVYPVGGASDERATVLARALRRLSRARRLLADGDRRLAEELAAEAMNELPRSKELDRWLRELRARQGDAQGVLDRAKEHAAAGRIIAARDALVGLLEVQSDHRDAREFLGIVEVRDREDQECLRGAREKLDGSDPQGARELLVRLEMQRPDLEEVPVLLRDAERRVREARIRALEAESRLFAPGSDAAPLGPAQRGLKGADRLGGRADGRFRAAARRLASLGPLGLDREHAFVLRVEEQGDWLVQPQEQVVLGNSMRGRADLPVLAAIASRHAIIRREPDSAADDAAYFIEPARDRSGEVKEVYRNRRLIESAVALEHGDRISLAGILDFTFLKPVPGNATAVLRFEGDFTTHACSRVILFSETGRGGSIVIGPGPMAHVPLALERDQVELLRPTEGEHAGTLLARSRRGVNLEDGAERPQVKAKASVPIRAGNVGFFLDPVVR